MSQALPRVFVTQENSQLNYGHAEEFGEIVFLTAREVSAIPGSIVNADLLDEVCSKLATFDFEHDSLAPSGSPTVCGLAFFCLGRYAVGDGTGHPKTLRILRWSNRDRVYQPITISIDQ